MRTLRHVVSGTDFSECSERAIELAITLALAALARVTVVHVCEFGTDELDDSRLIERGDALSQAIVKYRGCGVELAGVLRIGRPWEKLDNVAADVGAGLIVVGRQGVGRSAALGSVAERLVRLASRPVLIVDPSF